MNINSAKSVGGLPSSESRIRLVKDQPALPAVAGGAQVELSSLSSRLQEADPVVDAARVAEIKQAISEGRFQVNAEKVADSLIESVREMLSARHNGA